MPVDDLISRLPKAEVHLHLEGTIAPTTLWDMAQANHVALPFATVADLQAQYQFTSFRHFIELWLLMCSCLRAEDDYRRMVDGFLSECGRQNIRYAECHFTPYNHEQGIGGRRALQIVSRRLAGSESAGGPVVRLIVDIPGESAEHSAPYTLSLLEEEADPLVVALGLGGPEEGFPRARFAPWFDRARAAEDPSVLRLLREWRRAHGELGVSIGELWDINLNGLRYGLADTAVRRRLLREFVDARGPAREPAAPGEGKG